MLGETLNYSESIRSNTSNVISPEHSLMSWQPWGVLMKPLLHWQWPLRQVSPFRQSLLTLHPGLQNLSMQISPWRQFLSVWHNFRHMPSTHCSPRAQSACSLHSHMQYEFRHLCPFGQFFPEQGSGIRTHPWIAVGTPKSNKYCNQR